jgi:hypothetical protein
MLLIRDRTGLPNARGPVRQKEVGTAVDDQSTQEMNRSYAWRLANAHVWLFLIVCALLTAIPARPVWYGAVTDRSVRLMLSAIGGIWVYRLTMSYVSAIAAYKPTTALQAKRANEQIKLTANFANTVSAAWISVIALSELIKSTPDYSGIAVAVIIAGMVHGGARNMVGLIKDEAINHAGQ